MASIPMLAIKALNARATYLLKHLKDGPGDRKVGYHVS